MQTIIKTYSKIKDYFSTLTPNQYDFYKEKQDPSARTIESRSGKKWNQLLYEIDLPIPPDRQTLAKASNRLHEIQKSIVDRLGVGWNESSYYAGKKILRPDSSYLDKLYHGDKQLLILDVKLCITSAPLAIYKYIPIFEEHTRQTQLTFFSDWVDNISDVETTHTDEQGQQSFFENSNNNILYIAYLLGKPTPDIAKNSHIIANSERKRKRLPQSMEVRFISFCELPELYCQISDIDYDKWKVKDLLDEAEEIKRSVGGR